MLMTLIEMSTSHAKGLELNSVNKSGDSPLHMALSLNHLAIVQVLIRAGSNLTLLNGSGNSALHVLAQCIADNRDTSTLYMKVLFYVLMF